MSDPSPLSVGLGFLAFFGLVVTILAVFSLLSRDRTQDAPLMAPAPEPPDTRCSAIRPHRMLPTAYGWRCANDCGERWEVEESDDLAAADLALWELDMGWVE